MSDMKISLSDALKSFVDAQVSDGGYGSSSEYVGELIHKDQERLRLRSLLLEGAESATSNHPLDESYFQGLRSQIRKSR